jgi:hypothetical protein
MRMVREAAHSDRCQLKVIKLVLTASECTNLTGALTMLNVESVADVLTLQANNKSFGVLNDLLDSEQQRLFSLLVNAVERKVPSTASLAASASAAAAVAPLVPMTPPSSSASSSASSAAAPSDSELRKLGTTTWQLSAPGVSLLFVPLDSVVHHFLELDVSDASVGKAGVGVSEHVIFALDCSASMNHDAKNSYQPPNSPDHASSSCARCVLLLATDGVCNRHQEGSQCHTGVGCRCVEARCKRDCVAMCACAVCAPCAFTPVCL